jgi:hypothetical protein
MREWLQWLVSETSGVSMPFERRPGFSCGGSWRIGPSRCPGARETV